MTQEEFNEMFLVAMNTFGAAQENESDVPTVNAADYFTANEGQHMTDTSLPMLAD